MLVVLRECFSALLETNISPYCTVPGTFESMVFRLPPGGICDDSLEGIGGYIIYKNQKNVKRQLPTFQGRTFAPQLLEGLEGWESRASFPLFRDCYSLGQFPMMCIHKHRYVFQYVYFVYVLYILKKYLCMYLDREREVKKDS